MLKVCESMHGGGNFRYGSDYTRCLSEVTQRKGELTEEQELIWKNDLKWGCDGCQNCLPL